MGFLDGLGKMMQGKPVFEPPSQSDAQGQSPSTEQSANTSTQGPKVIPLAQIERVEIHNNGSHMRVTVAIQNDSDAMIMLDKIRLLGTMKELDTQLRPGESREFNVYDNQRPNHRNYDDAQLDYRDMSGDYFEARHTVEFRQEADNTYSVSRFRFVGPVKDI